MKPFIVMCCVVLASFSIPSFSLDSAETPPVGLTDLLSGSPHPGEGSLTFYDETERETINFNLDSGAYALGLVLKGEWLPVPYKTILTSSSVIQISMGTLKSKLEGKVPQFGIFTLVSPTFPKEAFAFLVPELGKVPQKKSSEARGLLTSPRALLMQSEREKLENTFFTTSGGVTFTPVGEFKQTEVRIQESKLFFKTQKVKLDFQMDMGTPFNAQKKKLTGSISFPVYTPYGKAAESLATKLAQSLEGNKGLPPRKSPPERKITGSKSKSLKN